MFCFTITKESMLPSNGFIAALTSSVNFELNLIKEKKMKYNVDLVEASNGERVEKIKQTDNIG
jgi:hypothetical protein